jgi:hypothetical protein
VCLVGELFVCYNQVGFAPNETFFAILVHLWKQKWDVCEFLVKIKFASNEAFFATLVHYESKSGIVRE